MVFDNLIDVRHNAARLRERGTHTAVMGDLIERKFAVLPILQPFLRRTIAADCELPGIGLYALEILIAVDPHAAQSRFG